MKLKTFLFLQRQAPLAAGPEAFDLLLTAAAFNQEVRLVLLDDGVFWLLAGLPELVAECVEQIAVERQSLAERGLAGIALPESVRIEERDVLPSLIAAADLVVGG
jgi:sulfur relay (sulfurtransferase) DsrF/TusC family protein